MKADAAYLLKLLDRAPAAAWTKKLRSVLISEDFLEKPDNPQSCIVSFALDQARRRQAGTREMGKETFGIEELIATLSKLDRSEKIVFYLIEDSRYLGTCYISGDRLLGCECVLKTGTVSKPGLWIDGKRIT
ncbi:hypothetical protein [Burkholderia sp. BCC1993]|uniref:hypothetical protein n=1 Tax=Burkholderia sp. BCC1993 TaxID=2817444 RepID=UPI002AB03BB5|nr:hypothetical protein [Burkholderia sp. BCC1993]